MLKSLFPFLFFGVLALMHYLAYRFFLRGFFTHAKARRLIQALLSLNLLGIAGYLLSRYFITTSAPLYFLFSLSIGLGFGLFIAAILYWLALPLLLLPLEAGRRQALKKGLRYASGAFLGTYSTTGIIQGAQEPAVVEVALALPRLRESFRAVQLSDIHIGGLIEERYMESLVSRVNALQPDCVFLTGDITDASVDSIATPLAYLGRFSAPLGVYFVSGNHEFFHGIEATLTRLREMGIVVLENQSTILPCGVNIAGVHDLFGRRYGTFEPDLGRALEQADPSLPTILLAHQPKFAKETLGAPIDLILSGHTHGGQIAPFGYLVKLEQGYLRGLYTLSDRTKLYVNPGTGFWGPPMRLLSRAEITLFHFTPKS